MYSYEKTFNTDAEEIFGKIHKLLKEANWLILSYVDVKEVFTKMDKSIDPYYILDVCYPPAAVDLIHDNEDIGAFIPCKIVLIQHGKSTRLIMPKPSVLSKEYLDTDGKVAEKYEKALIEILDKINS
ncbi:DUF302 domain-containing protein [Ferroplasma sp.]|uniref:DUF302 domain-containing protein n=1 Tax=Ferroplasma sp. TaxID=2591003 RepID=UPI00260CDD6A|nr:DUF302 domain-containing protein [Ferroplasma sp.]MCL4452968.1 DUF302 domain-containing protein [Candidatus Thermoplasmatota archaeon]